MRLAARVDGRVDARVDARGRQRVRRTEAERHPRRTSAANGHGANDVDAAATAPGLEALWDRHGASLYALACALLGDEAAAVRTVTLAMVDLARTPASDWPIDIPRYLSERVYRRSQTLTTEPSGASHVPASMRWLARLARLQRTCLALCVFGGYTHREVAELLDAAPATVAELLTTGLRELGHLAGGGPAIA